MDYTGCLGAGEEGRTKGEGMQIRLNEKYILNSDTMCCWISEVVESKKGKNAGGCYERRITGYHTKLPDLLKSFAHTKLRSSEADTLDKLCEDVEQIERNIDEFFVSLREKGGGPK